MGPVEGGTHGQARGPQYDRWGVILGRITGHRNHERRAAQYEQADLVTYHKALISSASAQGVQRGVPSQI